MSLFKKGFNKVMGKTGGKDEIKPQIIPHSQSLAQPTTPNSNQPAAVSPNQRQLAAQEESKFPQPTTGQFSLRTRSNADPVVVRPAVNQATSAFDPRGNNSMNQSQRLDKKINVRSGQGEARQSRPSILSARRHVGRDQILEMMMDDREKEVSSEDSGEAYKNNGEIAAVQTVDDVNQFNELAFSHRSAKKQASFQIKTEGLLIDSNDFDIISSPATIISQNEEQKQEKVVVHRYSEAVVEVSMGLNVVSNKNHFDQIRDQKDTITHSEDWRKDAMEDSDEELNPMKATVSPQILPLEKSFSSVESAMTNKGMQMQVQSRQKTQNFEIGGKSQKPKAMSAINERPNTENTAVKEDFRNFLIAENSADIEEYKEIHPSQKVESTEIKELDRLQNEFEETNRRTFALKNAANPLFRKRTTILTSSDSGSFKTIDTEMRSRNDSGREAVYRKNLAPIEPIVQENLPSEKSYDSESDIDLDIIQEQDKEEEEKARVDLDVEKGDLQYRKAGVGLNFHDELLAENVNYKKKSEVEDNNEEDVIQLIDESEHLFIKYAQQKLLDNKLLLNERASKALEITKRKELIEQRVLSEVRMLNFGMHEPQLMARRRGERDTCIAVSDEVVVIGTNKGSFYVYNRETQRLYGHFRDDGGDFENNVITCLHIHPLRTEYVAVGFQGGQFMICDLSQLDNRNNMLKPKKFVKDHHRGVPIVSIKFCDWYRERQVSEESKGAPSILDTQAWMIASVDLEGRVVISCVRDVALGILKASKFVILEPRKLQETILEQARFAVIEPRFFSKIFPQGEFNDSNTWLALANRTEIQILQVTKETCKSCFSLRRPNFYPSERSAKYEQFPETLPVMAWGYGRSPCYKHRTQTMLAVAWGPLIQIVLLIPDDEKIEQDIHFRVDGQYFIAPGAVQDVDPKTSLVQDIRIESMKFLQESVLLVYTSTHDIRVVYTQCFLNGTYVQPSTQELDNPAPKEIFEKLDSRLKLAEPNSALSKEQRAIEMERRKFLSSPLQRSSFGGKAQQTLSSFQDWVVFMTEAGFCSVQHMTWQEYVETSDQDMDSTWIDTFQKTLDIFDGKIKGFKGVIDDRELRQESMKAELKMLVTNLIDKLIVQWKVMAQKMEKSGRPLDEVTEYFQQKQRALIKKSIEMCVDIWEPFFLFNDLFQKFVEQEIQHLLADELKPYILSGTFSDTEMPEAILVHHILRHPYENFTKQEQENKDISRANQEVHSSESPAESFEKIIVNLNFNCCSPDYQHTLLNFCKEKRLTTGHFYLAMNHTGDDGIRIALHQLRNFYLQFKEEENDPAIMVNRQQIKRSDLFDLKNLPADMAYREVYEKSAVYQGYKVLWVIRLTLLGKRFPKGIYERRVWQDIVHEVLDIITQLDYMKTLIEIDASAFFQIITIVFNNTGVQYEFLLKGRAPQVNLMHDKKPSMSHAEIIKRISDYCLVTLEEGNEVRLLYLFFIASIAEENQELRDQAFYYKVTLELLKNHHEFMTFNKSLIQRQMTQKQMYRKLSRKGVQAPDQVKHIVLSEESIMVLVRKCEPLTNEQINILVTSIADTNFDSLKLMLYEKQEAYTKCLKLLVERESVSTFVTIKMRDRFAWIIQTYFMLESRLANRSENTANAYQFNLFEQEIFAQASILTRIDSHKAVGLVDCLFQEDVAQHLAFILRMKDQPKEQFMYTEKLLEIRIENAKQTLTEHGLQQKMQLAKQADSWLKILNINLELACQLEPNSVVEKIKKSLKMKFYPAEECLKICTKHEMTEACAILCKNVGKYKESVEHYVKLVNKSILTNVLQFRKELHSLDRHIRVTLLKQKKQLADKEMEAHMKVRLSLTQNQQNLDMGNFQQLSVNIDSLLSRSHSELVPVTYSQNFTLKEKFVDAIQLKVFISSNCPNVTLLQNVLDKLIKMIKIHPEEILKVTDEIWLMIIKMMFRLSQHKDLFRKRYCRRFLIVKTVTLVREMLRGSEILAKKNKKDEKEGTENVKKDEIEGRENTKKDEKEGKLLEIIRLREILNAILKMTPKMKFRNVRQLVSEVFWDKRAEVDLCKSASTISFNELKEIQDEFLDTKADGLAFKYDKCDICEMSISKSSLRFLNSLSLLSQNDKTKNQNLIMFDCSKESNYNHAFHESCLKKFIQDEQKKNKKASLKDQDLQRVYRCVVCYQQSQSIKDVDPRKTQRSEGVTFRRGHARTGGRATPNTREQSSDVSDHESAHKSPLSRSGDKKSTKESSFSSATRTMTSSATKASNSNRINKLLTHFDEEMNNQYLRF